MAKKIEKVTEKKNKINLATLDVIDKNVRNFLIQTKNQEQKVDNIIDAISATRSSLQSMIKKMLEDNGCKEGEKIQEDKIDAINLQYRDLVENIEVDKTNFEQYSEDEFNKASEGLILPYQELKILKYWLIKKDLK